jgi:beta-glucosidase
MGQNPSSVLYSEHIGCPNGISNDPKKGMARAEHYAGYSETQGGRDASEADLPQRKMRSWFRLPFQKITEWYISSYMTSYEAIDGIPAVANSWLLKDILRKERAFKGIILPDFGDVGQMMD